MAVAFMAVVFVGLLAGFRLALDTTNQVQAKTTAVSLANARLELLRSMTYDDIGTVGGIPQGSIPQVETVTINGRDFTIRTLIYWVDDPADGLGADDVNQITTDYKEAKVEVSWETRRGSDQIFLLTRMTPRGMESTVGGGTLTVNVFNANLQPVEGADVRILNTTTTSTIDTIRSTNVDGAAVFGGAPAAPQYQLFVTRPGYSSAQTHQATTTNPNPTTQPVTVVAGENTTLLFQIDRVSQLVLRTLAPGVTNTITDDFSSLNLVAATTSLTWTGSVWELAGGPSSYESNGSLLTTPFAPSPLARWETLQVDAVTGPDTSLRVQVLGGLGTSSLAVIPNSDLAGNETGFTTSPINLLPLDVSEYPVIALQFLLTSATSSASPLLQSWQLSYTETETTVPNVDLELRGSKVIGQDGAGVNIPKLQEVVTTDTTGAVTVTDLEWDQYRITAQGTWVVSSACPFVPIDISPNSTTNIDLTVVPAPARSLRVGVRGSGGAPLSGAEVTLSSSDAGLSVSQTTNSCGQVWFGSGLSEADDYQVNVTAPGYSSSEVTGLNIDNHIVESIQLNP